MSIRLRLTLWYSGILAVTLLLFGIGLYLFLHYYQYNTLEKDLADNGRTTFSRIQKNLGISLKTGLVLGLELENRDFYSTNTFLQLYNVQLNTVHQSVILQYYGVKLPIRLDRFKEEKEFFVKEKLEGQDLLIYNIGIFDQPDGKLLGVLQTAIPIGKYEMFFERLQYILTFLALLTILLAASLGWFLARKALMPIDQVIEAANRIESGHDLERRILYDGPRDEIGRLTDTINGMLSRIQVIYSELDEAYRAQRRFVSDASHELRTPLTTIRGNVDLLEKMWKMSLDNNKLADPQQMELSLEAMQDIAGEAQRMSRLVNDLLALARADAGFQMEKVPLEMKPLIEEVVRRAQFLPRRAEWIVEGLEVLEGTIVEGNRDYIQQLLFIFIENAFKYTAEGVVRLDALRSDTQIGVRIADTGIGMDKEEVPMIFERFYRADPSRGQTAGTGLGLSIAKWIIDEHNGSIEVTTSKEKGSIFVIWFPAAFSLSLQ
ncbi:sensor histidine kinase [Paenibacillus eucommiae]|uniref:histidine kinase n=1 Tax=Paenibacillus eucommiae TaxID=1355755 RepID=A0ABS4J2C5_9BACL|nr:HAMP domain-containing sensor histidine kinase [Paenibacillus eucommiae]MBP1993460.1 signal transduction histidine kinase [Paenibacillus eucommiae]